VIVRTCLRKDPHVNGSGRLAGGDETTKNESAVALRPEPESLG
jgi:hypothetical protein